MIRFISIPVESLARMVAGGQRTRINNAFKRGRRFARGRQFKAIKRMADYPQYYEAL